MPETQPKVDSNAQKQPATGKIKSLVRIVLTVAISVLIGLVIAEVAVRLLSPHRLRTPFAIDDPNLLYRNEAGVSGRHSFPTQFDYSFSIDSKGCRGTEVNWQKPPGIRRIVCVGDSFTWGVGVEDEQTYPAQLQQLLNSDLAGSEAAQTQVVNAGVMGWGVCQYYIWGRAEGLRFQPDVMVLGMFEDDWTSSLLGLIAADDQGMLTTQQKELSALVKQRQILRWFPFFRWVMTHSQLANLVRDKLRSRVTWPPRTREFVEDKGQGHVDATEKSRKALALTQLIIQDLNQRCRQADCKLLVIWIPTIYSVQDELDGIIHKAGGGDQWAPAQVKLKVADSCEKIGIEFVDATAGFVEWCKTHEQPPIQYTFELDGHFRANGNRVLAEMLADRIR